MIYSEPKNFWHAYSSVDISPPYGPIFVVKVKENNREVEVGRWLYRHLRLSNKREALLAPIREKYAEQVSELESLVARFCNDEQNRQPPPKVSRAGIQ